MIDVVKMAIGDLGTLIWLSNDMSGGFAPDGQSCFLTQNCGFGQEGASVKIVYRRPPVGFQLQQQADLFSWHAQCNMNPSSTTNIIRCGALLVFWKKPGLWTLESGVWSLDN